jgi:hypothetical protein
MKIKNMICKTAGYLFAVLTVATIFACNDDNSKKGNKESNKQIESKNIEKPIDSSYKKNIRLFDQFYYDMPSVAAINLENNYRKKRNDYDDNRIELTYKGVSFFFKKNLLFKNKLLKEVVLESYTQIGLDKIIDLYTEKYGTPKIETKTATREIDDVLISGLIKINDPLYDPKIHKEISKKEYYKDTIGDIPGLGPHGMLVNEKFKIVEREFYYYKLMKNITTDELVSLKADVIKKKYRYKIVDHIKTYTWLDNKKLIKVEYLYKNDFIGNLNKISSYKSMSIFYKNSKDIVRDNLPKDSDKKDKLKKNELNTLQDI